MRFSPIAPTDLKGNISLALVKKAEKLAFLSAALNGGLPERVYQELRNMLRSVNSYYSNSIESEGTHPVDTERAINGEYDKSEEHVKTLQQLSIAHMKVQMQLENIYSASDPLSPYGLDVITTIHKNLYSSEGLDELLQIKGVDDTVIEMVPGEIRKDDVYIAKHIAPEASLLQSMMREYEYAYSKGSSLLISTQIIYAISSHHRLTWIHPFLDGNGRVSRLALDGAFYAMKLPGYGLWNISRGLARNIDTYKEMLAYADMPRQGATDGRGELSSMALERYVDTMLDIAIDQVSYIGRYLKSEELAKRMDRFFAMANSGILETIHSVPDEAAVLFKHLLLIGECKRGEVRYITGLKERTARTLISELSKQQLITSDTPKSNIYINFRAELAQYLFPEIVPPYIPSKPRITTVAEEKFKESFSGLK